LTAKETKFNFGKQLTNLDNRQKTEIE